ncbi:glycine cleavage system aminomethyltransferase GcvT [Paenibacillus radicis (ex Xue et al. 2023)]|uniref:Aminomethyltransferase n=1 Tax=Paenibacillus radicis (ex Xue et al. 2023) TaxID=2972489 RepID=A0ABT1YUU8_9BACL|nr:glycine cleavage system aminomethyltransferase GcvT [Paenibacillus radicis (ex Xue et al. 2023)]MCR8636734.1 glycine cleavage system aminomethyltransferase GcvT [Paenibacillus radicis (ex Xue et al. 2023)]
MSGLKRTPLFPIYKQYGAPRVIDFGGWELPVQFYGIQKEHEAVRQRAGLFDVSHMGEVMVTGRDALTYLQNLTVNDVSKLMDGQAQYSLMCYEDGGVVDDLLVYRLSQERFMLVINASNIEKDVEWMQQQLTGDVTLDNISEQTALLAIQGPAAEKILGKLTSAPLKELKGFSFISDTVVGGFKALVSRTGYTGEDGFELYINSSDAQALWEQIMEAGEEQGLMAAGLGARDTLRFEAKLPLYGQELSAGISPLEASLGFFVKLDKGDFIGRAALVKQKEEGVPRKLVGIEMIDRGIPRSHYPVYADGKLVGEVTTGTQSPTLKQNLGLALIDTEYSKLGTEVWVEIREKQLKAVVVKAPFYKREMR